jgi:dihydropteroate synthase
MKAIMRPIFVHGVKGGAANLLKQEMLARGGDTAVPIVAVMHPETLVDVCLLGTLQDYQSLLRYLRATPIFGLPELAERLERLLEPDFTAG